MCACVCYVNMYYHIPPSRRRTAPACWLSYMYMYLCIRLFMYVCIYLLIYMFTIYRRVRLALPRPACRGIYIYVYIYIYLYICICVCVFIYIHKRRS